MDSAMRILEDSGEITWDYDAEADVLYLSIGEPKPSTSVDAGDGVVIRYDEERQEVTGITFIGLRKRLMAGLQENA